MNMANNNEKLNAARERTNRGHKMIPILVGCLAALIIALCVFRCRNSPIVAYVNNRESGGNHSSTGNSNDRGTAQSADLVTGALKKAGRDSRPEVLEASLRSTFSGNLDAQEKLNRCGELVHELVPLIGIEKTIGLLNDIMGSGVDRDLLIATAFEWSTESTEDSISSLVRLNGMGFKDGYIGITSRILRSGDTNELIKLISNVNLPPDWDCIRLSMSLALGNTKDAANSYNALAGIVTKLPRPLQSDYLSALVKAGASGRNAFGAWDSLTTLNGQNDVSPELRQGIQKAEGWLVNHMVSENPTLALDRLRDGGEAQAGLLSGAMETWLSTSKVAAERWYAEVQDSLSRNQKDQVIAAFSSNYAANGQIAEGKEIQASIVDPELRQKVGVQLWAAEAKVIDQQSSKDPAGTLQSIVSGQSKHEDYWIEGAMWTWIAKDPAKADEWYQKNWASLPAGKAQYVAAAYVTDSLKQGDTASARQWAVFIQEPNTKRRIEAAITQAEGQKGK
jgi:hypothetical protein